MMPDYGELMGSEFEPDPYTDGYIESYELPEEETDPEEFEDEEQEADEEEEEEDDEPETAA